MVVRGSPTAVSSAASSLVAAAAAAAAAVVLASLGVISSSQSWSSMSWVAAADELVHFAGRESLTRGGIGVQSHICLKAEGGARWLQGCCNPRCLVVDLDILMAPSSHFSSGEPGEQNRGSVCCTHASIELLYSQLIRLNNTYYTQAARVKRLEKLFNVFHSDLE